MVGYDWIKNTMKLFKTYFKSWRQIQGIKCINCTKNKVISESENIFLYFKTFSEQVNVLKNNNTTLA